VHRNAIVNASFIEKVTRPLGRQHRIHLQGFSQTLQVSRRYGFRFK